MMFRFPDGSTKVIAYGQQIRGIIREGQRPISVMFTLEEVIAMLVTIENHVDLKNVNDHLRMIKYALKEPIAA